MSSSTAPSNLVPLLPAVISPSLQSYLSAFHGRETEPFITFYPVGTAQQPPRTLTRAQLWNLSSRFAYVLKRKFGLGRGDCVVHLFAGNSIEDVALRLAAVMVGTVPVTVNWDSDPIDRIIYKVQSSHAKLVLTHNKTPKEQIDAVEQAALPGVQIQAVEDMMTEESNLLAPEDFDTALNEEDTRIIIYTSGSSGEPKGVRLSYQSYITNHLTFESFLQLEDPTARFTPLLVNPLHHTNSTAFSDWALRRPGTHLHLYERYTTGYWATLTRLALFSGRNGDGDGGEETLPTDPAQIQGIVAQQLHAKLRLICPTVSRHFDFLETLVQEGRFPVDPRLLQWIAPVVTFVIGSAPVGPSTVSRLMTYLGRLPTIRFGSTETCLQVMGTPLSLPHAALLEAFQRGWNVANTSSSSSSPGPRDNEDDDDASTRRRNSPEKQGQEEEEEEEEEQQSPGFYVGRPHPPYTEVMVVQGIDPKDPGTYLKECPEGVKGYLVTRGKNLMKGYVQGEELTRKAIHYDAGGWYTNLGDVFFYLISKHDGAKDYYWVTRTSNLLIRGGTNYSYDQVSGELSNFIASFYNLPPSSFSVAAVGLRLSSEHEDDCLVTIELLEPEAQTKAQDIEASFLDNAKKQVSKGAKPTRVRMAAIPRNFKGDVNWRSLEADWKRTEKGSAP